MKIAATLGLLLCLFNAPTLLAATLAISSSNWQTQQLLQDHEVYRPTSESNTAVNYLDALPNTVGVLFMNSQDEGVHLWLPIGKRVFVDESPVIPAGPLTARITSMVAAPHAHASVEALDRIMCRVYPRGIARSSERNSQESLTASYPAVAFRKQDGLVRLVGRGGLLEEREVESYECLWQEHRTHIEPESRMGFLDVAVAWVKWWFLIRGPPHLAL